MRQQFLFWSIAAMIGLSSCNGNNQNLITKAESDSLIKKACDSLLNKSIVDHTVSLHIPLIDLSNTNNDATTFISLYRKDPIAQFIYQQNDTVKAFYIDNKLINAIRNNPPIDGLYLYLARRKNDAKYTFIAIPSSGRQLDTSNMYEWHDPVTTNNSTYKPVNESELGY